MILAWDAGEDQAQGGFVSATLTWSRSRFWMKVMTSAKEQEKSVVG
jgi:hypothetical protein